MKKIFIIFFITIILVMLFRITVKNFYNKEGCDTYIAKWNFDSNVLGRKCFSLAETVKNNPYDKFILPR